jgi:MFS family permease
MEFEVSSKQPVYAASKINNKAWAVCLTAALVFFYEFLQMNMLNAISNSLIQEFFLSPVQLGLFSASFFYANAIFLLPAGILLDRFSTKKIVITVVCLCIGGTLLFAYSASLWLATIGRFITGLCNAFAFLACMQLAVRWFPPQRIALITGAIVTLGMLGGVMAQTPFALMVESLGWRMALVMDALLGVIIVIVVAYFVQDFPAQETRDYLTEKQQLTKLGFWKSLTLSVNNSHNWLAGLYTCFTNLPLALLGALWGNLYLMQAHHLNKAQASTTSTLLFIGMIIGSPLIGWFSDQLGLRKKAMLLGSFILLLISLTLPYMQPMPVLYLMFIFFLLGFCASIQVIGYAYVTEVNPRIISSTAMGFASVVLLAGCAIFQPLFGWLMKVNMLSANAVHSYQTAIWLLPVAAAMSVIVAMFFKEMPAKVETSC